MLCTTDELLLDTAMEIGLGLPNASRYGFAPEWEALRVGGKWFLVTTQRETRIINVKATPDDVLELTHAYPSIKPAYHMNKKHWVSITPGHDISSELLEELISNSYHLVACERKTKPV